MPSRQQRSVLPGSLVCVLLGLAGCEVGRDYRSPAPDAPPQYARTTAAEGAAGAENAMGSWWQQFNDPELDSLIARGLAANLDMRIADSRIRQARYRQTQVGAALYPSIDTSAAATRTKLSQNSVSLGSLALSGSSPSGADASGATGSTTTSSASSFPPLGLPGTEFNTFQLGFDMSWELDLFGHARRASEAAVADTQALGWTLRDTWVSLAAEIAQDYFQLRAAQERIGARRSLIAGEQRKIQLLRAQVAGNLATILDVQQEQAQLALNESELPPLQMEVEMRIHALGVLTGQAPETLLAELSAGGTPLAEPPAVPAGLPSELLERRPDIRAAERRLAQASAKTGEATADLYPRLTLTASPGLTSTVLSNLLSSNSENGSIGGSLAWNLFDAGKLRAALHEADEKQRESLLSYHKAVLIALQDVEDALSQLAAQSDQTHALERSLSASRNAEATGSAQYRAGIAPLTTLLSAQTTRLEAEDRLISARADLSRDTVALYKALGGGWQSMQERNGP